jgi:hypothetical protein
MYHASCVDSPIRLSLTQNNNQYNSNAIIHKSPESFLPSEAQEPENSKRRTYDICLEVDWKMQSEGKEMKRRLVSLFEANEVAKRVTAKSTRRYGGSQVVINGGVVDEEVRVDVLGEMGLNASW